MDADRLELLAAARRVADEVLEDGERYHLEARRRAHRIRNLADRLELLWSLDPAERPRPVPPDDPTRSCAAEAPPA